MIYFIKLFKKVLIKQMSLNQTTWLTDMIKSL